MRQYIDTAQDLSGNALAGATVKVLLYPSLANATIYSDNGLTPIGGNTVAADITGQFSFFAADGDYALQFSYNALLYKTQSPVSVFDGAAQVTFADTGAVNAYAIANSALEKALRAGLRCSAQITTTNTGASTLQYNGLAVKSIVYPGGTALTANTLLAGGIYQFEYDGASWQIRNTQAAPYYARTAGEIAAGVTPVDYSQPPGSVWRQGADPLGVATATTAFSQAAAASLYVYVPPGTYKLTTGSLAFTTAVRFVCAGRNSVTLRFASGTTDALAWSGAGQTGGGLTGATINGTGVTGGNLLNFTGQARGWFDDITLAGGYNGMLVQDQNVCNIGGMWMNGLTGAYGLKYFGGGTGAAQVLNIGKLEIGFTTNIITSPIGVLVDGDADTINADAIGVVKGANGMVVQNSGNLAGGPAFITVNTFQSDFAYGDGLSISGGTGGSPSTTSHNFLSVYCQGSVAGNGVSINQYARDIVIGAEQITGNFLRGILTDGRYVKINFPHCSTNSKAGSALWPEIEIGANSIGTSILGGLAGQFVGYAAELASYGIKIVAGAKQYCIIGVNCTNNVTGAIQDLANDPDSTILGCPGSSINRIAGKGIALTFEAAGIPMIIPSSGNIGNNGALTAITALNTTYANCYMFFPAGAIFAGSAAGVYYVQMSSTTAGTIFNNQYTNGVPTVPASPTPFVTTGPGAYTQSTGSAIILRNSTIVGGSLGPNGSIEVSSLWSYPNSAGTKTGVIKYSSANILNASGTTTTTFNAPLQILQNNGVTNKQVACAGTLSGGVSSGTIAYTTIDSTADQTLQATGQLSAAADFLVLERMIVRIAFSL